MKNTGTVAPNMRKFLKEMPGGLGQIDKGFLDKLLSGEGDIIPSPVCGTKEWRSFLSEIEGINFHDEDVRQILLD